MLYLLKYTFFLTSLVYITLLQTMPASQCLAVQNGLDKHAGGNSIEAEINNPIEESEDEKWTGIDVSIVGKYAEKYGHPPRKPYINTDQGDLLLFVFTVAGLIGGFIIGYNIRKLFIEGHNHKEIHTMNTLSITSFEHKRNMTDNSEIENEAKQ